MTKFSLKNKVAIVTGGGSGIGKAISTTFAGQGGKIHILDFNMDGAKATVAEINETGATAVAHKCDVSDQKSVNEIINAIAKEEKIDILINNAGIAHVGNIDAVEEEDLDRLYNVNIKGVYNCIKAALPSLKSKGGGSILNIASIASTVGIDDRFAYSMTKGAVLTMTYSIAKDYIKDGIRCNCIAPGRVHTPFVDGFISKNYPGKEEEMFEKLSKTQPIGRMGSTQEIADLSLFLSSDEAGFITGSNYAIDGGFVTLNG
ncbi:glucose 1-dehydrogenase [Cellulophaga baltica]|uniref:SDR family NAD(P)-dependent oxidoreductase n=1 Tax=Cellulophaga TaxID=104264 RepID=UPI001C071E63|nr:MULTISPECIES: glucose 1-dehydrogenase [Cellulophaga]MBU2996831.1 glucose 1-dehydrogenase [Cellulophaga baltica]MDO6768228.1 glucose 1-dehydrogenase [Cellulophaga sp. 1_MG-2023]